MFKPWVCKKVVQGGKERETMAGDKHVRVQGPFPPCLWKCPLLSPMNTDELGQLLTLIKPCFS